MSDEVVDYGNNGVQQKHANHPNQLFVVIQFGIFEYVQEHEDLKCQNGQDDQRKK